MIEQRRQQHGLTLLANDCSTSRVVSCLTALSQKQLYFRLH